MNKNTVEIEWRRKLDNNIDSVINIFHQPVIVAWENEKTLVIYSSDNTLLAKIVYY